MVARSLLIPFLAMIFATWPVLLATAAEKKTKERLAVLDIDAKYGVEKKLAEALSVIVRDKIHSYGDYQVMSTDDIRKVASREQILQAIGCDDGTGQCLISFGRAIGTRFMVAGDISKFGATYTISLRILDTKGNNAGVINRVSDKCKCNEDALIGAVEDVAAQLLGKPSVSDGKDEQKRITEEKVRSEEAEKKYPTNEKQKIETTNKEEEYQRKADGEKQKLASETERLNRDKAISETEQKRIAEEKIRSEEAAQKRITEEKKQVAIAVKKAEEETELRLSLEKKLREEVERQRKAEEEKQQFAAETEKLKQEMAAAEAEQKRIIEEKKKSEEVEQKRIAEEKQKVEVAAKKAEEETSLRLNLERKIQEEAERQRKSVEETQKLSIEIEQLKKEKAVAAEAEQKRIEEERKKTEEIEQKRMELVKVTETSEVQKPAKEEKEEPIKIITKPSAKGYIDLTTGMEFVFVQGGCYMMGDTFDVGESIEKPVHEVCVDNFLIGKYEVTQGEYSKIANIDSSGFKGERYPVEQVSWDDIQKFLHVLNNKSSKIYRLPTEAEWEFAARSRGKDHKYAGGDDSSTFAWFGGNSDNSTHPVGTKKPNELGIYDMSGNVWEWCNDYFGSDYYSKSPKNNPTGPSSGWNHIIRGGSWDNPQTVLRAALRSSKWPGNNDKRIGFRLVLPVNADSEPEIKTFITSDKQELANKITLRRESAGIITNENLKKMIISKNFYKKDINPASSFKNDFLIQNAEIVLDKKTGLLWQATGSPQEMGLISVRKYIKFLNNSKFNGYSGWRLPTIEELSSLMNNNDSFHIDPLFSKIQTKCWSSDEAPSSIFNEKSIWVADFKNGEIVKANWLDSDQNLKNNSDIVEANKLNYVRAVRDMVEN